jgi:hypothetical protein
MLEHTFVTALYVQSKASITLWRIFWWFMGKVEIFRRYPGSFASTCMFIEPRRG